MACVSKSFHIFSQCYQSYHGFIIDYPICIHWYSNKTNKKVIRLIFKIFNFLLEDTSKFCTSYLQMSSPGDKLKLEFKYKIGHSEENTVLLYRWREKVYELMLQLKCEELAHRDQTRINRQKVVIIVIIVNGSIYRRSSWLNPTLDISIWNVGSPWTSNMNTYSCFVSHFCIFPKASDENLLAQWSLFIEI